MAADRAGDRTDRHQVDDHRRPGAVRVLVGSIRTRIAWAMDRRALRKSAEKWRAELKVPAQSKIAVALDAKLQELQAGKTLDHQELLHFRRDQAQARCARPRPCLPLRRYRRLDADEAERRAGSDPARLHRIPEDGRAGVRKVQDAEGRVDAGRAGFAPAKRVVDGYEVYTWRPAD